MTSLPAPGHGSPSSPGNTYELLGAATNASYSVRNTTVGGEQLAVQHPGRGNTTTLSPEQLFYLKYDPSTGIHTAALLGGVLVWVVIYVFYRTHVRKRLINLFKPRTKKLTPDVVETDPLAVLDPTNNDVTANSALRPLIQPSIVIEKSSPGSMGGCDRFTAAAAETTSGACPNDHAHPAGDGQLHTSREQHRWSGRREAARREEEPGADWSRQHLLQLPRSELDIPAATAHWVHTMPLEGSRSQQDLARLVTDGRLVACSCPLVPAAVAAQTTLPLLDLPVAWQNSLPLLSSSLSSQLVYACPDPKGLAHERLRNAELCRVFQPSDFRNLNKDVSSDGNSSCNKGRYPCRKKGKENDPDSLGGVSKCREHSNLTIDNPDQTENYRRSPVPLPVTPTVTIYSSATHHGISGNTSLSSSSTDIQPTLAFTPSSLQIPSGCSPHIPAPYLLASAGCRNQNNFYSLNPVGSNIPSHTKRMDPPCDKDSVCSFKYTKSTNDVNESQPGACYSSETTGDENHSFLSSKLSKPGSVHQRRLSDIPPFQHLYHARRRLSADVINPNMNLPKHDDKNTNSSTANTLQVPDEVSRFWPLQRETPGSRQSSRDSHQSSHESRPSSRDSRQSSRNSYESRNSRQSEHGKHRRKSDFSGIVPGRLVGNMHHQSARRHSTAFQQGEGSLHQLPRLSSRPFSLQALLHPSGLFAHKPSSAGRLKKSHQAESKHNHRDKSPPRQHKKQQDSAQMPSLSFQIRKHNKKRDKKENDTKFVKEKMVLADRENKRGRQCTDGKRQNDVQVKSISGGMANIDVPAGMSDTKL